jgi:hypothetical protein
VQRAAVTAWALAAAATAAAVRAIHASTFQPFIDHDARKSHR